MKGLALEKRKVTTEGSAAISDLAVLCSFNNAKIRTTKKANRSIGWPV